MSATFATSPEQDAPARSFMGAFSFDTDRRAYVANGPTNGARGVQILPIVSSATAPSRVTMRTLRRRAGSIKLRLTLAVPASVSARATAGRRLIAARSALSLPAGASFVGVSLSVRKLGVILGRHRRSVGVSVKLTSTDGTGRPETRTVRVSVVR